MRLWRLCIHLDCITMGRMAEGYPCETPGLEDFAWFSCDWCGAGFLRPYR